MVLVFCLSSRPFAEDVDSSEESGVEGTGTAESADGTDLSKLFELKFAESVKVKLGAGARTSLRLNKPEGGNWNENINLDNVRLYLNAQALGWIGLEVNTDIGNAQGFENAATGFEEAGNVRILDAVAKIEPCEYFNVWLGRMLPPSDRANLSGPYYSNVWDFPYVQFGYPNIFQGRDDGVAIWGQLGKEKLKFTQFKWQLGVFEGNQGRGAADPNNDDNIMYTGRLVLNFLDEEPGYYNSSTYYGEKDILGFGVAAMHQEDAVGLQGAEGSFTGFNFDLLFEKKLTSELVGDVGGLTDGVFTLDAAYYDFDDDNAFVADTLGLFTPVMRQGESYFVTVAYLIPGAVGYGDFKGRFQPFYRYQNYDRDVPTAGQDEEGHDAGVHYVFDGHNARFSLVYQARDQGPAPDIHTVLMGAQLQF
jgi:hypothetical protein